jgi:threonine dehydratase
MSPERQARAEELAAARSLLLVPPFDDESIVAGQGTVGLELARDLPAGVAAVLVPCGGGGLLSGIALALSALRPEVELYAVEPGAADAMGRSLEAGRAVRVDPGPTLADGLKPSQPGVLNLALCRDRVRAGLRVDDAEILWAVARLATLARLVVEPSGAVPLAALRRHPERFAGRRVALVLTGGNIAPALLARAVAAGLTP